MRPNLECQVVRLSLFPWVECSYLDRAFIYLYSDRAALHLGEGRKGEREERRKEGKKEGSKRDRRKRRLVHSGLVHLPS